MHFLGQGMRSNTGNWKLLSTLYTITVQCSAMLQTESGGNVLCIITELFFTELFTAIT